MSTELEQWNKDVDLADELFNDAPEVIEKTGEEETETEDINKEDKEDEDTKSDDKKEIDADDLFNDDPEKEDEEETDKGKSATESPIIQSINHLKEKGLIDFELEEGEELNEDDALDILEQGFEDRIENRIEELFEELPKEVRELNKFVINGGSMNEFLGKLQSTYSGTITSGMDLTKPVNQEIVVREMYKKEGYDDEFIETQITSLKDSNKLEYVSKTQYNKWEKGNEEETKRMAEEQRARVEEQRIKEKAHQKELREYLSKTEEVGGIKLDRRDPKELTEYISSRNIKLQNGAYIAPFQKDLMEVLQSKEGTIQLAKLLKNRNKDNTLNFSIIEKQVKSKTTKDFRENLRRSKPTNPTKSVDVRESQGRSLADFF